MGELTFALMFICAAAVFLVGFKFYGRFMSETYGLSNDCETPAVRLYDGIDYCPAHPAVLLGHHFSSIAGAGPITGPIAAAMVWGWFPTLIWCMVGSTFLGGPHDMGSLVASLRHDGKSIGEVIEHWMGRTGKVLFLCFTILTLILVVAVFLALSVGTFVNDAAVAFVSCLYIGLAVVAGLMMYRTKLPLWVTTVVMLAIIGYACVHVSPENTPALTEAFKHPFSSFVSYLPTTGLEGDALTAAIKANAAKSTLVWYWVLSIYILLASILPVWLLLQPRDYLASYFLYFAVIVGAIGMLFGSHLNSNTIMSYDASKPLMGLSNVGMWPMLFITVACGAISGFHSLVGSGTTAKQLAKEKDSVLVGYGAMLIEGLVAVIALGTLMVVGKEKAVGLNPVIIFSQGFGRFAELIGCNYELGVRLGAIAINSFLLTSLDTATRLTRYEIQEISNMKINKYAATIFAVVAALLLVVVQAHDVKGNVIPAWKAIWPVFGSANQLVAALSLLGISVWVRKGLKKDNKFLTIPFWFMFVTTFCALVLMIKSNLIDAAKPNYLLGIMPTILVILAVALLITSFKNANYMPAEKK
nr:carbon starvation CstA family protein [Jonquetella anthropi]